MQWPRVLASVVTISAGLFLALGSAAGPTGPAPASAPSPIDNLRTLSRRQVEEYASSTDTFVRAHGASKASEAATDQVRQKLKDPDSARFQNVRLVPYASGKVVCGEVNAKNSYGGYVGYTPFVAGVLGATIYDPNKSEYAELNAAWNAGLVSACGP